jgi:hypothetical protein
MELSNTVQDQPIATPLSCKGMETIRPQKELKEEALDPLDWPEFRQFAHSVLDGAISYASSIRQFRVWRAFPIL